MTKTTATTERAAGVSLSQVPFATVGKSTDINWRRWSVMARGNQTEWYKSEAQAIKKADALCKAAGSITWTEYAAAKAARARQIEALPKIITAAKDLLEALDVRLFNGAATNAAEPLRAALKEAGVL